MLIAPLYPGMVIAINSCYLLYVRDSLPVYAHLVFIIGNYSEWRVLATLLKSIWHSDNDAMKNDKTILVEEVYS